MAPTLRDPRQIRDPEVDSPLSAAVSQRDRSVIMMVERAVRRRDVTLAFQPVIQAARPDRPAFHEALIRVLDDTGRIIPAREFFDTVETTELGRELDCLALEMGLQSLGRDARLRLAVNMSARSISHPKWLATLRRGIRKHPDRATRLILEISEASAMVVPDTVSRFMREFQAAGVSFALDDFGAGETSFRHLRQFLFDMVKIDGQYIRGIAGNPDNQVVTAALLSVARQFDMFAVAESVESAADAAYLGQIGMDCLQGYYFGAPTLTPPWRLPDVRKSA